MTEAGWPENFPGGPDAERGDTLGRVKLRRPRAGAEDLVAERVKAADEPPRGAMLVDAVEVIGPEIGEADGLLQLGNTARRILCATASTAFLVPLRVRSR